MGVWWKKTENIEESSSGLFICGSPRNSLSNASRSWLFVGTTCYSLLLWSRQSDDVSVIVVLLRPLGFEWRTYCGWRGCCPFYAH
jgi:hypothetical protein